MTSSKIDTIASDDIEISVGRDDTDKGVKLGVEGDPFWRVHITPQGEVLTGDGTATPTTLAVDPGAFAPAPATVFVNIFLTQPNATVGTWVTSISLGNLGQGFRTNTATAAQNDSISYDLALAAGTWTFTLVHGKGTTRGIYTVQIDGVTIGTIDGYAAAAADAISTITGVAVATPGLKRVTLLMATKNPSSTNYAGVPTAMSLGKTA